VLRGEHTLQGFRNREVRTRLFGPTTTPIAGAETAEMLARCTAN
jgi:hypothetical protein